MAYTEIKKQTEALKNKIVEVAGMPIVKRGKHAMDLVSMMLGIIESFNLELDQAQNQIRALGDKILSQQNFHNNQVADLQNKIQDLKDQHEQEVQRWQKQNATGTRGRK